MAPRPTRGPLSNLFPLSGPGLGVLLRPSGGHHDFPSTPVFLLSKLLCLRGPLEPLRGLRTVPVDRSHLASDVGYSRHRPESVHDPVVFRKDLRSIPPFTCLRPRLSKSNQTPTLLRRCPKTTHASPSGREGFVLTPNSSVLVPKSSSSARGTSPERPCSRRSDSEPEKGRSHNRRVPTRPSEIHVPRCPKGTSYQYYHLTPRLYPDPAAPVTFRHQVPSGLHRHSPETEVQDHHCSDDVPVPPPTVSVPPFVGTSTRRCSYRSRVVPSTSGTPYYYHRRDPTSRSGSSGRLYVPLLPPLRSLQKGTFGTGLREEWVIPRRFRSVGWR